MKIDVDYSTLGFILKKSVTISAYMDVVQVPED